MAMNGSFAKFKKRLMAHRVARAVMAGCASGMALGGVLLLLSKNLILDLEPIASIYFALGALLIVGGLFFLFGGVSDGALASRLDREFDLSARVATMVEYNGEDGDMLLMQRQDTEQKLSEIPIKRLRLRRLPIYIVAVLLSAALLCFGIFAENKRGYTPPEEVDPFVLTELQEAGMKELIKYVENSPLEEEFKTPMVEELQRLLDRLKEIDKLPDMQMALTESMALLLDITYDSSSSTEMLDALWDTGEINLRYLAFALYGGDRDTAVWGDFAEGLAEYIGILLGDNETDSAQAVGIERLKWALDSMNTRLPLALDGSGLAEDDEMYLAVKNLFLDPDSGLMTIYSALDYMSEEEARAALTGKLDAMSESTFRAIALNRANAAVGEYAMTRLSAMFGAPLPQFERPEFIRKNLAPDGNVSSGDDDDDNGTHQGGLGEGATFGTDDYVLDPLTGEYVKVGELINTYNALMFEKLEGDLYTEQQKIMIRKYFELLFSGLDEEGK